MCFFPKEEDGFCGNDLCDKKRALFFLYYKKGDDEEEGRLRDRLGECIYRGFQTTIS